MKCYACRKKPEEIDEYRVEANRGKLTPEEFVMRDEGTYDPISGFFLCTECYIMAGMPERKHLFEQFRK